MFYPKVGEFLNNEDTLMADERTHLDANGNIVTDEVLWALTDQQGSVNDLAKVDANGVTEIADHIVRNSFGKVISESDPSQGTLIGYAGLPLDKASGYNLTATRPYDSSTGRFPNEDWIRQKGGDTNLYRYCGNSPTNFTDPSGMSIEDDMLNELKDPKNIARLREILRLVKNASVWPFWCHRCHAWVGKARDAIVKLGKPFYENDEYTITYVDWSITERTGHGGLRIQFRRCQTISYRN